MLAVIFGILKILGLLILGILGLILLVLCLILFVPVCYRAQMSLYDRFCAEATVSWLFRAVSLTVRHSEETEISVRIFGIPVRKKSEEPEEDDFEEPGEESSEKESRREDLKKAESKRKESEKVEQRKKEKKIELEEKSTAEQSKKTEENSGKESAKKAETPRKSETLEVREPVETSKKPEKNKIVRIFQKIPQKIKKFWNKIKKSWKEIGKRLRHACSNLQKLNEKRRRLMEFLQKEENKRVFRLLKRQTVRFFRHVFPQKLSGKLAFSLGDPYLTGKVLTYVSPFYGFYGRDFALTPVFDAEELVLEGEAALKGRIRIGTVLWIGLQIIIDKDARRLWKQWRNTRR